MHLRRRIKRARRKRKQLLHPSIKLRGCRKQAIVAASRRCRQPVGDFFLHHDDNGRKIAVILQQPQQNVGRDVIRQIADHARRLGLKANPRVQHAGLQPEHCIQFDRQDIAFDDFNIGLHVEFHPQLRRQDAVQFHRNQPPRPSCQQVGERAAARPNLQHRRLRNISQRLHNAQRRPFADQEMLPQFRLARTRWCGCALRHVDPLSRRL